METLVIFTVDGVQICEKFSQVNAHSRKTAASGVD